MVDLFRCGSVSLCNNDDSRQMMQGWERLCERLIDELQLQFDRKQLSSEVHILYKLDK